MSDGLLDKRPFWMVGCMSAPKVGGRWVKRVAPLLQSPTDTAAAVLPEGPTQSTRGWTSVGERHLTGLACRHGCPLLDVAIGGDFNRVGQMALDRSKAKAAP